MTGATMTAGMPLLSAAERRTRNNGFIRAGVYAVAGLLALWVGLLRVPGDQLTVYKLVFEESVVRVPDLSLPVGMTYATAGVISLIMAGLQFRSPSGDTWRRLMAVTIFALVFAVLTGILGGKEPSLVGLTSAMVSFALPIVFAGLAAILCERSGVMNIGIEGIILLGACATSIGGSLLGSPLAGIGVGVISGALLGLLLAVLSIRYHVDQVIAGTVLNLAAAGITTFMYTRILQVKPELNDPGLIGSTPIPILSEIRFPQLFLVRTLAPKVTRQVLIRARA